MDQDKIREWVRDLKKKISKTTNHDIAKIWGKNDPTPVSNFLRGVRPIKLEEYAALVRHIKSIGRLNDCLPLPLSLQDDDGGEIEIRRVERDGRGYNREHYTPDIPGSIPELDVYAGAGEGGVGEYVQININGETQMGHRVVAEWKFPEGYLHNVMKVSHNHSMVMEVRGDSMDPTIRHGDKVIVDLRNNSFGDDGLYLISDGHSAPRLKRLEYVFNSEPPTVKIISDNPSHRDVQTLSLSEVCIVGRVAGRIAIM